MLNIRGLLSAILTIILLSSIQSFADTFVVTNLNDSGEGSLRRAITISNAVEGPDEIVFEEGLEGTILHNLGTIFIQDDLTIVGPGADKITIDAVGNSDVFAVRDFDDEINRVVKISGLRFINGNALEDGAIVNYEILTVDACEFINGNAFLGGGAIGNRNILTVDSCLFDSNFAPDGGAIMNYEEAFSLSILNSIFIDNQADRAGAIHNSNTIEVIKNSTFMDNNAVAGGVIMNRFGTINEISNCTFVGNFALRSGGAISNSGLIKTILNSTFNDNIATTGGAIWNSGLINISFTTISGNQSELAGTGGGIVLFPPPPCSSSNLIPLPCGDGQISIGQYRIRNSIIAFNTPSNCTGPIGDIGGNYSDDFSCGLTGDGSEIILGPLANNGGPTETMDLIGGDPVDGATVNCDALNEMGNPTGVPIGIDQRYFPRPFGLRCDSGAVEDGPESIVTITKASEPPGRRGFEFESDGFSSLVGCGFTGDNGHFILDDGDSIRCGVPEGDYSISENVPIGYELFIVCFGDNDNLIIDNKNGEITFSVPEIGPSPNVDCIFTNIRKGDGGNGGGCTLASAGANNSIPLYLFIPALILIRRFVKRYRS